jgi:uncharacterized protein (TIGR03437 family)
MRFDGLHLSLTCLLLGAPAFAQDWPMYLKDLAHSSFNDQETQLSIRNVATLQPAWITPLGGYLSAGVTLSNGDLFIGNWSGNFSRVDAQTGKILWTKFVGKAPDPLDSTCLQGIGVAGQPVVLGDTVYVGGGDSAVYAFDRSTGNQLWRVPLANPATGSFLWASMVPYNNALFAGVASLGDCPLVRGALARIDLANPQKPLIHYLSSQDSLGAGVWSTPAVDPATNTIFAATGNGDVPDVSTGNYNEALLRFDAGTLEIKSYFQLPKEESESDFDWGSSPTLFNVPSTGDALMAATGKDGFLYAVRQSDLSLVWKTQIAVGCVSPEDGCGSLSTPAFDGATLFVGAGVRDPNLFANGSVYAINPANGAVIWEHDSDGTVIAPVTVANGLVFASTTFGLHVYDAATGQIVWSDGNWGVIYSQPVVANGTIYASYLKGELVGWNLPVTGPATVYNFSAASVIPAFAPATIASLFGTNLSDTTITVSDSMGTPRAAEIFYSSASQINYLVPEDMATGRATVTVSAAGGVKLTGAMEISNVAPGLFSANSDGKGVAAAQALRVNPDGTTTSVSVVQCGTPAGSCIGQPIDLSGPSDQVFLTLYATGLRGRTDIGNVSCTIGGVAAPVSYAGPQMQFDGLDQVNVKIPSELRGRGAVDIVLLVDGQRANIVTVTIR